MSWNTCAATLWIWPGAMPTAAFSGCAGLAGVSIPDSVVSIGEEAFVCCTALASVTMPRGRVEVGRGAFDGTAVSAAWRENGRCRHCGGRFRSAAAQSCPRCGRPRET